MTDTQTVDVAVRWYTPEEGGRSSGPPPGPRYTPTARFADQPPQDMFSVVVELTEGTVTRGTIRPGFPENVPDFATRLARGDTLVLHEGRRVVAEVTAQA
jgi:hypothetical protein